MTTLLEPLRLERRAPQEPANPRVLHDWLLIVGLVAFYAALQSAFVHHPILSDQMHYLVDANTLPDISFPPHHGLRIGLTIPVWLFVQLFGYSEAAYYAVPYLTMAGLIIAVYWVGRLIDSRAAGVISAVLVVANPYVLDDASQLLPDLPAAALMTGAVALLLWQWKRVPRPTRIDRTDRIVLVGVGLLLGWSYLVREFIVLWFPVVALIAVVLRLPRSWWRLIAAGTGAAFAFELLWGLIFFGNPFARIWAALHQPASEAWRVAQRTELIAAGDIPNTHVGMLTAMPRNVVEADAGWILALLFVVLVVAALVIRSPNLRLLAVWTVMPIVLLTLVIQFAWLFDNRILRAEKLRYWLPVVPPLVVGGVVAVLSLARWLGGDTGRRVGIGVAAAIALVSLGLTGAHLDEEPGFTRTGNNQFLELREWLATSGQTCNILWIDDDQWRASSRWVPMYVRTFWGRPIWQGELRSLNTGDDFRDISELETGALLRSRIALRRRNLEGLATPDYLQDPPSSWRVLLATNRDVVRVLGVGGSTCARP